MDSNLISTATANFISTIHSDLTASVSEGKKEYRRFVYPQLNAETIVETLKLSFPSHTIVADSMPKVKPEMAKMMHVTTFIRSTWA